ncbi:MAG: GNAT family N-acetyltransferase [Sphaerobacter sp.]|nr:GNAT family N-acetyltransferase [Sphaerobacter sp.]
MGEAREREVSLRCELRPGDLGRVTELHGVLYAAEYGFDHTFESYVAESLGEFGRLARPGRDRLWLAERDGRLVGSIGIVGREGGAAQLRWFLVHPDARGRGLGRRLLGESLAFCRAAGYRSVYLWTVNLLTDAARLYTAAGFRLTEETPARPTWGVMLAEQRYDLTLAE